MEGRHWNCTSVFCNQLVSYTDLNSNFFAFPWKKEEVQYLHITIATYKKLEAWVHQIVCWAYSSSQKNCEIYYVHAYEMKFFLQHISFSTVFLPFISLKEKCKQKNIWRGEKVNVSTDDHEFYIF
jgi:hypothetical protein